MISSLLRKLAVRDRRFEALYSYYCLPSGRDWAEMLRERGDFHSMGDYCSINRHTYIDDRPYVRLGNNVRLARCSIFGHDGSVNMINRAFDLRLDNVGKVDICDNVYIGFGAIILPDVKIGPNAIVSAGSVVSSDVGEGDIVAGVPAKRAGRLEFSIALLKAKNEKLPWRHLVEQRVLDHYPADVEAEIARMRVKYFFGSVQKK